MSDLAEISVSSAPLEDILDPGYVKCLTTSKAWPLISTVESGTDAVFSMGMIFVFFQLISSPTLEAMKESVTSADLSWSRLLLRTAISSTKSTLDSPPSITDAKRVGMVRLVQDVVDDAEKHLRFSSTSLLHSILYGKGRRKLPVNQDGAFCVAVEFFEESDYLCG